MAPFRYCEICRKGETDWRPGGRDFKLCQNCFDMRTEYVRQIQRDKAYRSHLARQMEGYPCDITSNCPHHSATETMCQLPREKEDDYRLLIQKAFQRVKKTSFSSISALELLSGHHSSMVEYCSNCYAHAIEFFERNSQITLCNQCLENRERFIELHHDHQDSFREPFDIPQRSGHWIKTFEVQGYEDREYDEYLETYEIYPQASGGAPIASPALVFGIFGALNTGGTLASIGTAVKCVRQQEARANAVREDTEGGQEDQSASVRSASPVPDPSATQEDEDDEDGESISSFHTAESHQ